MVNAAVFIDAGYLSKVLLAFGKPKLDFAKLSNLICKLSNSDLFRTYYYDCMPYQSNPPIDSEKELYASKYKFIDHLNKLPQFEVRLGKLSRIEEGFKQKRVDILMMMDLVRLSQQKIIQKAILITGDSDFVPAIQEAKDVGVLTHVFFFRSKLTSIHNELYNVCDNRTEFTQEMIDSCLR